MITIREAMDTDGHDVAALLGAVFSEYEGCLFAFHEMPELQALAATFRTQAGNFFVAERLLFGRPVVVGCVGFATHGSGLELKKLYVAACERKTGLGGRLLELIESEALQKKASFIELWSDTRFVTAHRFYERRGYRKGTDTRELHDVSRTSEYRFRKDLT